MIIKENKSKNYLSSYLMIFIKLIRYRYRQYKIYNYLEVSKMQRKFNSKIYHKLIHHLLYLIL